MDISPDGQWIFCNGHKGCTQKIRNHAWGRIKAEGWFFSKQLDEAYCPDHIPDWVHAWRLTKRKDA